MDRHVDEVDQEKTVPQVMVGAWREAFDETGWKRVLLVAIVATITLPFLPLWGLLWALEEAGHYDVEGGFSL